MSSLKVCALAFLGLLAACSSSSSDGTDTAGAGGDGTGGTSAGGSSVSAGSGGTTSSTGGSGTAGTSAGGTSATGGTSASAGSGTAGTTAQAGSGQAGTGTAGTGSTDPLEMARVACIDKINQLRATKGLAPYMRWQSAESCVDQEVTSDEKKNSPHDAWKSGTYMCNGSGQNECLGQGVAGIADCLDSMWGEKDQPGCAGCDACADKYNPSCANCDFYGQTTGNVCGHYVNLSAKYFTAAACGFSPGSWDAINFQ